jgi:molybdenum cofactor synthesis domain-containing protein
MCEFHDCCNGSRFKKIPVIEAIGLKLAHDITEVRPGEFKCRAYKRGHIIRQADVQHLFTLGKEHVFVLDIGEDELHEDEAAYRLALTLMGKGVTIQGEPKEGRINIISKRDGLLKVNEEALLQFNMLGDVMCATIHNNTPVKKYGIVAGTRAIPLVVKKNVIEKAEHIIQLSGKVLEVKEMRRPRAGVVITGNEIYQGRIKDAFAPVISEKVEEYGGEIVGIYYAPDDPDIIADRLRELMAAGADLLLTTGGMSVDPDDVTRFAVRDLGGTDMTYGSSSLPGAMFLVAYLKYHARSIEAIPVVGIPACGIHHKATIFDLVLPRILAGERIGRKELAELGHGGLCLNCTECRYPICPFGKA